MPMRLHLLLVLLTVSGATRHSLASAGDESRLIWRGCGISKVAFMEACAKAYEKQTGQPIQLSGGGAQLGIESAASGGADLGGTCRACLPKLGEDELPVKLAIVAWDALTVIVHKDNPVKNITAEQLKGVLMQRITNWKELGGADEQIIVVVRRGKTSGVGHSVRSLILDDDEAKFGPRVLRLNSSGPVESFVERQPRAIAVTGISSARLRDVNTVTINGHSPNPDQIASGEYPYFRPLYIAFQPGRSTHTRKFVDWLLGEEGQEVIRKSRTVPLREGRLLVNRYQHFSSPKQIINLEELRSKAK